MQFLTLLGRMYVNIAVGLTCGNQVAIWTELGCEHILRGIRYGIFGRHSRLEFRSCLMMMRVHLILIN